jgi:hypothetical protein
VADCLQPRSPEFKPQSHRKKGGKKRGREEEREGRRMKGREGGKEEEEWRGGEGRKGERRSQRGKEAGPPCHVGPCQGAEAHS